MEHFTLEEASKAVGSVLPTGKSGKESVADICTDSRKLTPGCVFLALHGSNFDGHEFVLKAIEQGAEAAITEHPVGRCPCLVVNSTRKALLDLARFYRMKFSPLTVGVTGSVGKTSTKEMIALALSAKYQTLKNEGNLNNEIGVPQTLFRITGDTQAAVIEMGMSHFGEIHRLSSAVQPDMAVITNIGVSHIENLGSQEGILEAKLEILDGMSPGGPLILNGDDPLLSSVYVDRMVVTYGIHGSGGEILDARAEHITLGENQTDFDIIWRGARYPVCLSCVGEHHVYNALAAFTVAVLAEVPPEAAVMKISEYRPVGLRQRVEKRGRQVLVIDCYNASPDSMKAALSALACMKPEGKGRRVAVLADMLELGERSRELHEAVGRMAVETGVEKLICYGKDARYIAAQADELGLHSGCTTDPDMLLEYLKGTLRPDDIVLFKGSRGMKLESIIERLYPVTES